MRIILITITIVAALAGGVDGQTDKIALYSDPGYSDCGVVDSPALIPVYMVHETTLGAVGSGFMIDVSPGVNMTYINLVTPFLTIGDPLAGIAFSYASCQLGDFLIGTMNFLGTGASLDCSWFEVVADTSDTFGQVLIVDCAQQLIAGTGGKLTVNPTPACPCDLSAYPEITGIVDVGNDQGRQVRLSWDRSIFDAPSTQFDITGYDVYRRQDPNLSSEAQPNSRDKINDLSRSAQLLGWDYVGTHPVRGDDEYQMVVPTLCDSTATSGICWSTFMVSAVTSDPYVFFDSFPDSGYSVDNLAPFAPSGFAAAYNTGGGNHLMWAESLEEDLQYYNIYRGTTPGFTPGPANLVHSTTDTDWNDPDFDGWNVHYKLTALDFSGNESDDSSPEVVTGADNAAPGTTALMQNSPNPFNPTTSISFNTATAGHVTLSIFDASGKHVRTLVDENVSAGVQTAVWDGRDAAGTPVSSGVYFYRLTAQASSHTKKMVLLK